MQRITDSLLDEMTAEENEIFDRAYEAAYSGVNLGTLMLSMGYDEGERIPDVSLQFIVFGYSIGEIDRDKDEEKLRLVKNRQ